MTRDKMDGFQQLKGDTNMSKFYKSKYFYIYVAFYAVPIVTIWFLVHGCNV